MELFSTISIGAGTFASTNIDDIFVLLLFFGDRRFRGRDVVLGQYLGIAVLVAVSLIGASLALAVAEDYVGLLGIVPILIGLKRLLELRHSPEQDEASVPERAPSTAPRNILVISAVTFSNGGDNIGIYVPLFAGSSGSEITVILAVFAVLIAGWCLAAKTLVNHGRIGAMIQRYGHIATPFVLVALGLYIVIAHTHITW